MWGCRVVRSVSLRRRRERYERLARWGFQGYRVGSRLHLFQSILRPSRRQPRLVAAVGLALFAAVAATLMASVPVLILPLVILVYHEKLSWRAVLGAFIAVGGVALLFFR